MTPRPSTYAPRMSSTPPLPVPTPPPPPRGDLPPWDSFPLPDRRLLVGVIVQLARRQVHGRVPQRR